jgi:16S rRNA (cytosine967-C5)-methyltransferase
MRALAQPRVVATQILSQLLKEKLPFYPARHPLLRTLVDNRDKGLASFLCYGVLRFYPRLQWLALQLLSKPLKSKDLDIWVLLLCGLYQLSECAAPAHVVVNETVATTQALQKPWASKLVNAILRNYLRQANDLQQKMNQDIQAKYAHPLWLIQRIQQTWPMESAFILAQNNQQAPMSLRVNLQQHSRAQYLALLEAAKLPAQIINSTTAGIQLGSAVDIDKLPGFYQGWVSVQDGAAQLATQALELAPGLTVLDACAAPGGKSCHILEQQPSVTLTCIDKDGKRLQDLTQSLQRLGLSAQVITADSAQPQIWAQGSYDRILLDAPCSATGVIRRHPDIKLLRTLTQLREIEHQQRTLLNALWPWLSNHGILLYTTCSILSQENEDCIAQFIAAHPDVRVEPINAQWGMALKYGRQILPGQEDMDGFYYAK